MEVITQYTGVSYAGYYATKTTSTTTFESTIDAQGTAGEERMSAKNYTETVTSKELYYQQFNIMANQIPTDNPVVQQTRSLGVGFLFVGNVGMGMAATQIMNEKSEDTIIEVRVATGEKQYETFQVNLAEVNPGNASAIEMFAFCQYADANGTGVSGKWGSWHYLKEFSTGFQERLEYSSLEDAANQKKDWTEALSKSKYTINKESTGETMSAADVFKMLVETLKEEHKLTPDNIAVEEDWREMDDENWNKLLEHIDKYIDDFRERLKQLEEQTEEAAMKANADAPADQRAAAISNAILSTINSGTAHGSSEAGYLEKLSWTYEMATDDQEILATAKMANESAHNALTKTQEMALFGDTTVGISSNESVRECASLEKNDEDRVWTITVFSEDGIICTQGKKGETFKELWRIDYKNPDDAKRVQDFLDKFDKNANLIFSGSKDFWEDFLTSNLDGNSLFAAHEAVFDKAAPDAPEVVKKAWMNASKETGYLEGGKMNHISQLMVRQVINRENGVKDYQNVFGNSVASALQAAKELLYDLENPLTLESGQSDNARKYREQEKEFYRKFIGNLEEI